MTTTPEKFTAKAANYKGTPRKLRLLADFVRGKNAKKALAELAFVNKRHADGLAKVIAAAVANAKNNFNTDAEDLIISDIQVQEGKSLKRHHPGSRGRAIVFKRRLSHIDVSLEKGVEKTKKKQTN